MAILAALLSMMLMSALGAALVMTTTAESLIAGNFRDGVEARYAADAALERALDDLAATADWNAILLGAIQSGFTDGMPAGVRTLADGTMLDLDLVRNLLNCRKATPCSTAEMSAVTSNRPWGANNPVWRLFAYGPLSALLPSSVGSAQYVVVMVADDPLENDGDPLRDGNDQGNPGTGVVRLRSEAFGLRAAHQVVEATVARPGDSPSGARVVTWER